MSLVSNILKKFKKERPDISSLIGLKYFDDKFITNLKNGQKALTQETLVRDKSEWVKNNIYLNYLELDFFWRFAEALHVVSLNDFYIFRIYKNKALIATKKIKIKDLTNVYTFVHSFLNENLISLNTQEKSEGITVTKQIESSARSLKVYEDIVENNTEGISLDILNSILRRLNYDHSDELMLEVNFLEEVKKTKTQYANFIELGFLKYKKTQNLVFLLEIFKEIKSYQPPSTIRKCWAKFKTYLLRIKNA